MVILLLLALQDEAASWRPMFKDDRFELTWKFEYRYEGTEAGQRVRFVDIRELEAELVVEKDIGREGTLRVDFKKASWTYATRDYEIRLDCDDKAQVREQSRVLAPPEERAVAEANMKEQIRVLKKHFIGVAYLPVSDRPADPGGTWGAGAVNGFIDWMILHDPLPEAGRRAGEEWERPFDAREAALGGVTAPGAQERKVRMKSRKSRGGIEAAGGVEWTFTDRSGTTGKHSVKREWLFSGEGYLALSKIEVRGSLTRPSRDESARASLQHAVTGRLEIRRKRD